MLLVCCIRLDYMEGEMKYYDVEFKINIVV